MQRGTGSSPHASQIRVAHFWTTEDTLPQLTAHKDCTLFLFQCGSWRIIDTPFGHTSTASLLSCTWSSRLLCFQHHI